MFTLEMFEKNGLSWFMPRPGALYISVKPLTAMLQPINVVSL